MEDAERFVLIKTNLFEVKWACVVLNVGLGKIELMVDRSEPRKIIGMIQQGGTSKSRIFTKDKFR